MEKWNDGRTPEYAIRAEHEGSSVQVGRSTHHRRVKEAMRISQGRSKDGYLEP